jgi:hypothetical protein
MELTVICARNNKREAGMYRELSSRSNELRAPSGHAVSVTKHNLTIV